MKSPKLMMLVFSLLLIISESFAQIDYQTLTKLNAAAQKAEEKAANLPANEKKIDAIILDRVNLMTSENAMENYSGHKMINHYSLPAATVDGTGRVKIRISMFKNAALGELNSLIADLKNQGTVILNSYFPPPDIEWNPEITCFVHYDKVKAVAVDRRIANLSICSEGVHYIGDYLTQGDIALHADLARIQHDVDGGRHHLIKVGVISDGIIGYDTSQASLDLPISLSWLSGHDEIQGKEGRAMLEIVHDLAPGADLMFGSSRYGDGNYSQMTTTIDDMVSHNCDVIVDDVGFPDEPWFLDDRLLRKFGPESIRITLSMSHQLGIMQRRCGPACLKTAGMAGSTSILKVIPPVYKTEYCFMIRIPCRLLCSGRTIGRMLKTIMIYTFLSSTIPIHPSALEDVQFRVPV